MNSLANDSAVDTFLADVKSRKACKIDLRVLAEALVDEFSNEVGLAKEMVAILRNCQSDTVKARLMSLFLEILKEATKGDSGDVLGEMGDEEVAGAMRQLMKGMNTDI